MGNEASGKEISLFLFPFAISPADVIDQSQANVRDPGGWSLYDIVLKFQSQEGMKRRRA